MNFDQLFEKQKIYEQGEKNIDNITLLLTKKTLN